MLICRLTLIVILAVLMGTISTAFSQSEKQKLKLNVMSFNVRYNTPKDSINAWPYRKEKVAGVITSNDIDIVGVQEAWIDQIRDLRRMLPGYSWFGWSRDNGKRKGEFVPVFYKKDKFTVLEKGIFWFSETPEVAGSKGWDVKYPRIVVWARFKDKREGKEFYFFNTHLGGEIARYESARLLRSKIDQMAQGLGVIVTGDFNATPDSRPIDVMTSDDYRVSLADALSVAEEKNDELFTNYLFDGNDQDLKRIDYIFVSKTMKVLYHEIINKRIGRYYPSDHLPVKVQLEY